MTASIDIYSRVEVSATTSLKTDSLPPPSEYESHSSVAPSGAYKSRDSLMRDLEGDDLSLFTAAGIHSQHQPMSFSKRFVTLLTYLLTYLHLLIAIRFVLSSFLPERAKQT